MNGLNIVTDPFNFITPASAKKWSAPYIFFSNSRFKTWSKILFCNFKPTTLSTFHHAFLMLNICI